MGKGGGGEEKGRLSPSAISLFRKLFLYVVLEWVINVKRLFSP